MDQIARYRDDINRYGNEISRIDSAINALNLKIRQYQSSGYAKEIPSLQKQITDLMWKRDYAFKRQSNAQAGATAFEKKAGQSGGGLGRGGAGGGHYGGGLGSMRKK